MNAVKATWKDGHVVLEGSADWPEGRRLVVTEDPMENNENEADDAESIAKWIAEFEAIPSFQMTSEEEANWQTARREQREKELETFNERAEELRRTCE